MIASDVSAATSVYYTPYVGNYVPIWNGSVFVVSTFSELTLSLVANHTSNTLYDVFVFLNSGVPTLGTGPAWSNPGNFVSAGTLTTGTANRGTGAGTTELERKNGLWTNKVSMTARNGATTYSVGANQGTYLGTIWIDATAGQITCHVSWGQNRKWGVWNAYNRLPITLLAGDSNASWTYTGAYRASRNDPGNSVTVLCGLAEERVSARRGQSVGQSGSGGYTLGIGQNSTTVATGFQPACDFAAAAGGVQIANSLASLDASPFFGLSAFCSIEKSAAATTTWISGKQASMQLDVRWWG